MAVKLGRMSPSLAVDVKEESNYERPDAAEETVADDSENDETSDAETGDRAEQKPLSHQQAMEHFKDALAEIVVVCTSCIHVLTALTRFAENMQY